MKAFAILIFLFWVAYLIGEVLCIVKFVKSDFEPSYKREFIYGLGAISDLGGVIGYLDIKDNLETKTSK